MSASVHKPASPRRHHRLGRHELLRLARPARLRVEHGTLWITEDLNPEDIVLEAGESYDYDGRRPLLATPLGNAVHFTTLERGGDSSSAAGAWRTLWPRLGRLLAPGG
jgi:hypothetical protein